MRSSRRAFLGLIGGSAAAGSIWRGHALADTRSILHRGNGAEPTSLDPALATIAAEVTILRDMFVGLTTLDSTGETRLGVASNHDISPDGLRHTFNLREDSSWSDGTPLTAEDFVYSFRRLLTPTTGSVYPHHLFVIRNARAVASGTKPPAALGVSHDGPSTLQIDLEHPVSSLEHVLQLQVALPVPRHAIERHGNAWTRPGNIVVNGPYLLEDWQPQSFVRLRANPRFGKPLADSFPTVMYYPTANSSLEVRRFRAAELDVAVNVPPEDVPWLRANLPQSFRSSPGLNVYYVVFNLHRPPFDSPLVRKALALAIDRKTIVEKVLRTGELPAYSLVPPGTPAFHPDRRIEELDLDWPARQVQARRLLSQAGYDEKHPLELEIRFSSTGSYGRKGSIAVAAMWHMIGVRTRLLTTEGRVHFSQLREGAFEVAWADWGSSVADAASFLELLQSEAGPANYGRFSDAEFDSLFTQAQQARSAAESGSLLAKAEARAMLAHPIIPVFSSANRALVSARIEGWSDNLVNAHPSRFLRERTALRAG